jgi:hypothetical protein
MSVQLVFEFGRWHAWPSDRHMRRIFHFEASRPDYWVNGPQVPVWRWEL